MNREDYSGRVSRAGPRSVAPCLLGRAVAPVRHWWHNARFYPRAVTLLVATAVLLTTRGATQAQEALARPFTIVNRAGNVPVPVFDEALARSFTIINRAGNVPAPVFDEALARSFSIINRAGNLPAPVFDEALARLFTLCNSAGGGDRDMDGDVDGDDFTEFDACFTGPEVGPIEAGCGAFDFDCDGDVDCDDYDRFVLAWTEPEDPPIRVECVCPLILAPQLEPDAVAKNRYLSFLGGEAGKQAALRVTLTSSTDFPDAVGQSWWVGTDNTFCENSGQSVPPPGGCGAAGGALTFTGAKLQCSFHCQDWGSVGLVHVFGEHIVPDATYEVQAIDCECDPDNPAHFSAPLEVGTPTWSDACGPGVAVCTAGPDGTVDFANDLIGVLDKFVNRTTGLMTARSDLGATDPAENGPDQIIDIVDIVHVIDAFRGASFPFAGPTACP